ncbi:MAG TPA: hypothetical protein VFH59_00190 [Frateuria sp.]|uniref:hypothetical protein n=1 Tax=Frateuria sp. TaxID=2211372 RepID=UPI002D7ECBE7|nr:hypothetical protein [Frateuria sp.]HET6803845.1 hypothetical protein [Frateuria sp.]
MHNDESLSPPPRPVDTVGGNAGIKLPAPRQAQAAAMPGGVPPMFAAGALAHSRDPQGDAMEH